MRLRSKKNRHAERSGVGYMVASANFVADHFWKGLFCPSLPYPPPPCENSVKSTTNHGKNTSYCSDKGFACERRENTKSRKQTHALF